MTTPSKAVRPCIAYEANDCGYYSQSDADAIFESLEAELRVTKRALELAIEWTNEDEPEKSFHYTFEEFIALAIKE